MPAVLWCKLPLVVDSCASRPPDSVCRRQHLPRHPAEPVESDVRRLGDPDVDPGDRLINPAGLKIRRSKLLLPSSRAGSKTVFVVANLRGFERRRSIPGSYSGGVCPRVCYNVINVMIYGRRGCILFG